MNILIPHHWLLEHLKTEATPEKIRDLVSLSGPSVERIENHQDQPVYDVEVTTNRVDTMSVRGFAREAAAILTEAGEKSSLKPLNLDEIGLLDQLKNLPDLNLEIINDPALCQRILAASMSVSRVGESPDWLRERLTAVGQRPLNNLIDVTNYIMWELGHPIHVFDLDKLTQGKIIVRQAKEGEKLVTLDDKTHTCCGGEVVFDDGTGTIIDLPGIMGTKNTMVDSSTKNILVWIESVSAKLIRTASMSLNIRSQAAVLNEKHVDPNLGKEAILAAVNMYQQIAGGEPTSKLYDDFPGYSKPEPSQLKQSLLTTYLGFELDATKVERILTNLGCQVSITQVDSDTIYQITPPTYRQTDLSIPQDYIEEVARIYGYHNMKSSLMTTAIPTNPTNINHILEQQIKTWLSCWGAQEVYTYSLVSAALAQASGQPLDEHYQVSNPLTDDLVYLRTSLIPSHLQVLGDNKSYQSLTIFELSNIYLRAAKDQLPIEQLSLTITTSVSYQHLKSLLEGLMSHLFISDFSVTVEELPQDSQFMAHKFGRIVVEQETIGLIGETKKGVFNFEIDFALLAVHASSHPAYQPIPTTAPIIEDLTFTISKKPVYVGQVASEIYNSSSLVDHVEFLGLYQDNYSFKIIFWDKLNQLSADSVAPIRDQVIKAVEQNFNATRVG